uniref:Tudor domain containing 7 a n=1 Tax=Myripristis murdjan TaxID=586833 RepID=A0A667XB48_9TELE
MLRSVLQSSKGGVSVTRLQSDYMSLCGEGIPVRKLGYTTLEEYLRSIPSVVRMEYRMGQLTCFAAVCKETAHIAELVAKQRTSKKPGHSQLVNCRMRPKPSNPYMLKPRSSLRQPSLGSSSSWPMNLQCGVYDQEQIQGRLTQLLTKYCSGLWLSKLPGVYKDMFNQHLDVQALTDLAKWTSICSVSYTSNTTAGSPTIPSTVTTPKISSGATAPKPTDVRQKLTELLSKYSNGLWVHALPKLFMDTYKTPFPEHILDNLHLLLDICNVEHPLPDKKKAILYKSNMPDMGSNTVSQESQPCRSLPSGVKVLSSVVPPLLVLPSDQYPSVLVTDALNSNTVTVRYVGENYSNAQEAMEDAMCSFYSQSSVDHQRLHSPAIGQLAAVRGEEGDELARVQIIDVMTSNKVKVYYVDYGFSAETSLTSLLELHQNFLSLPFQATSVRLAGLELHSSHPSVLSTLDSLAIGKILLMETLEPCNHNETSVVVLYDTSQDDDVNINSACLKALQDKTMDNPLTVNTTYQDVCVTNVCSDGLIYCQLPSRGTAKLSKLLDKTEAFFISQVTSDSLVSRPFGGKLCLARYKGRWSRVEITSLHGRVVDILFIDLGIPASVEVTELREMPPPLLNDFLVIPPQAIRCRLADLSVPAGDWSPHAILWLKEAVLGSEDCRMKVLKLDLEKADKLVHMYLFTGADSQELDKSINHQLSKSELWQKLADALVEKLSLNSSTVNPVLPSSTAGMCVAGEPAAPIKTTAPLTKPLPLPPPLDLPQPGQNMDVFVPVACHPGHFVIQPWQDVHKLVVLMGEMILYYNKMESTTTATQIQKGEIYAAKVDKNWHRVLVKGILSNRLVSVYKLDHGKHELVSSTQLRPLIEEFRQLPFQAISAQLAGVGQRQWSEEVSMIFREHVENRGLVAQVESVLDSSEGKADLWERRLTVYLVDTNHEDRDIWIHNIMLDTLRMKPFSCT